MSAELKSTLIMFSPKCKHCGEVIPHGAGFCVECGKPFHSVGESTRPPAEVRPIRPINDSVRLPEPPKLSALAPISLEETKRDASTSWNESSIDEPARSIDRSAESLDKSAESIDRSASSMDESRESIDKSSLSMDLDGGLLAPTERSKTPWIIAAGVAFIALLMVWPSSHKKTVAPPVEPEEAADVAPAEAASVPVFAPTSAPVVAPEAKPESPSKAAPTPVVKSPKAETPIAKPEASVQPTNPGVLGALQAQETKPEPEAKPEPKPEPKPDTNAGEEAAGFLDEN